MTAPKTFLVADIGGTHARFAIAERRGGKVALANKEIMHAERHAGVGEAARAYLDAWKGQAPEAASFAVAGPVRGDAVVFTNSPWRFSISDVAGRLGLKLGVMNDFQAMARGAVAVPEDQTVLVKEGDALAGAPVAILGPGTGLGLGLVFTFDGVVRAIATEGGHAAFAPMNEREIEILRVLLGEFGVVSYERILSGQGLVNVRRAICAVDGVARDELSPAEITEAAMTDTDHCAREVAEIFCAVLGSFAGDAALMAGARGGVVLAGGILPKIQPLLMAGQFRERFVSRGPMSRYVEDIPVRLLVTDEAPLIGAALLAEETTRRT